MAIVLGTSPVWRFFVNGAPAYNAVMRFWKNDDRDTTQPAYLDAGGTNPVTEITLNNNGEPATQLYFDDSLTYYITVTNQTNSITYYEIQGYVPGVTNVTTNFYLQQNYAPNPQFYFHKNEAVALNVTATEYALAPPTWFAEADFTVDPATFDAITFVSPTAGATPIGNQTNAKPETYLRYTKTNSPVGQTYKRIFFKIPSVRAFAGQTITLKMDIKASVAMNVNLFYQQNLGTGSGGSGEQAITVIDTEAVTTDWTTISASTTLTALDGLTIGSNSDDQVIFGIDLTGLLPLATGTVDITNVQMFEGSTAIDYAYSDPFYDTALSFPVPRRPVGTADSRDSGRRITVTQDGFYTLTADSKEDNLIWGGDFSINPWQEGVGARTLAAAASANQYITDGYKLYSVSQSSAFAFSHQQQAEAPTLEEARYFTQNSLYMQLTAGAAGIQAGDLIRLTHVIEGYDLKSIAEQIFSMSFWVRTDTTGIYCVTLKNSADDLSYTHEFEVTMADTWQKISFTVPAYTGGTWNYTNGTGLEINWVLTAGSTYQITGDTDTWANENGRYGTATQNNWAAAGTPNFYVALPQLHKGQEVPAFPDQFREQTLAKARRYFEKSYDQGTDPGTASSPGYSVGEQSPNNNRIIPQNSRFIESKRTIPTITLYAANNTTTAGVVTALTNDFLPGAGAGNNVAGSVTAGQVSRERITQVTVALTVHGSFHWLADARF